MKDMEIQVGALRRALAAATPAALVDVREFEEHARERLPGSLCVPLTALAQQLNSYTAADRIVFVCQTGVRSLQAASFARTLGYRHAVSLAGGLEAWRQDGQPIESGELDLPEGRQP
jgi:rhodanese-related sulfurtransferase